MSTASNLVNESVEFLTSLVPPNLVVGNCALIFWSALDGTYPLTRHHGCWVLKKANVMSYLPYVVQPMTKKV